MNVMRYLLIFFLSAAMLSCSKDDSSNPSNNTSSNSSINSNSYFRANFNGVLNNLTPVGNVDSNSNSILIGGVTAPGSGFPQLTLVFHDSLNTGTFNLPTGGHPYAIYSHSMDSNLYSKEGQIVLEEFDKTNRRMKGTFSFKLAVFSNTPRDSIQVTGGEFLINYRQ